MFRPTRQIKRVLFLLAIVPFCVVCHAQTPEHDLAATKSLWQGGPIEPLRDMAGKVEVHLLKFSNEHDRKVSGALIGLDTNWVVVRIDHMNDEKPYSNFQWIPVSNIERMIQSTVYPERLAPSAKQLIE